jgi:hypothetical protein
MKMARRERSRYLRVLSQHACDGRRTVRAHVIRGHVEDRQAALRTR